MIATIKRANEEGKVLLADTPYINDSIVDGLGIRFVIFAQGCQHLCSNCHNPNTHSFDGGQLVDIEKVKKEIYANRHLKKGITLSGGDMLFQHKAVEELSRYAHSIGLDVWLYTGFTFEEILKSNEMTQALKYVDVLVDGKYVNELRDLTLRFRGSSNQRVIDVQKSLKAHQIILAIEEKEEIAI